MQQSKILLLDFLSSTHLSGTLRLILESPVGPSIDLRHQVVEVRRVAFGPEDLSRIIKHCNPDLIFFVLSRGFFRQAKGLFETLRKGPFTTPTIVVFDDGEPSQMVELLKVGATDFITAPLKPMEILPRVWRLLERTRGPSQRIPYEECDLTRFIGQNPAFVAEIKKIPIVARCDTGVLILGETGTGKELFAKAIHSMSSRAPRPFVPVNCGALPVELAESELFGHERGAFTGASLSRPGMIDAAEGGTMFLDEVACLPMLIQAKLLRFLQEKEFRAVGAIKVRKSDIRIIAATNVDLREAVCQGKFRQDLYYRLDIVPFLLPPLRDRQEDIPLLACHFLNKCSARYRRPARKLSPQAMASLLAYDWPGNVRELEHAMERVAVLCEHEVVEIGDLLLPNALPTEGEASFQAAKAHVIAQFEKGRIQNLLLAYQGNISRAARAAHKSRRSFWELMRKYRIDAEQFRAAGPLQIG
jgi:two-component system, NtrC family, response regulator GlrR